jgi:hypothetical protein
MREREHCGTNSLRGVSCNVSRKAGTALAPRSISSIPGFARAQRIYNFHTNAPGGFVDRGQAVVETDNASCVEPTGNCWETSGIIDASAWFGAGSWLFDVQAHSLPIPSQSLTGEGGQLLLLRLPGS